MTSIITPPPLDIEEVSAWISLGMIYGLGGETFRQLLSTFGTPQQIYAIPVAQLKQVVKPEIAKAISAGIDEVKVKPALEWLQQAGNRLVTLADADYPQALLEIADPPSLLYVKGDLACLKQPTIAIVGSRNATPARDRGWPARTARNAIFRWPAWSAVWRWA